MYDYCIHEDRLLQDKVEENFHEKHFCLAAFVDLYNLLNHFVLKRRQSGRLSVALSCFLCRHLV